MRVWFCGLVASVQICRNRTGVSCTQKQDYVISAVDITCMSQILRLDAIVNEGLSSLWTHITPFELSLLGWITVTRRKLVLWTFAAVTDYLYPSVFPIFFAIFLPTNFQYYGNCCNCKRSSENSSSLQRSAVVSVKYRLQSYASRPSTFRRVQWCCPDWCGESHLQNCTFFRLSVGWELLIIP